MTTYDFVMKQRELLEQQEELKAKKKLELNNAVQGEDNEDEKQQKISTTTDGNKNSLFKKLKLRLNNIFKRNRIKVEPDKNPEPLSIISGSQTIIS